VIYQTTQDLLSMGAWQKCQCGDKACETISRECLHGLVSIIPGTLSYTVKTFTPRGVEITPLPTLMMAVDQSERDALSIGGWLR